jgi:hypothetical protein
MLTHIKTLLRITSADFNDEIQDLIDQAKADLVLSGVRAETIDESDILIKRAIGLYCKTHFGYEQKDYERLLMSYHSLKAHLTTSVEYGPDNVE